MTKKATTALIKSYRMDHPVHSLHIALAMLLLQLFGCAGSSQPTAFYILNPITTIGPAKPTSANAPTVGVGPISLPKYLDRPEIVTRLGPNRVKVDEFNIWAGSLIENLELAIMESLSLITTNRAVVSYPWKKSTGVTLQVGINIRRFDIDNSDAILIADWSTGNTNSLSNHTKHRSEVKIPVSGIGYAAKIAALNLALDQFTKEIAASIK